MLEVAPGNSAGGSSAAELRVIVGRGHHSSGSSGEASLGRVVENQLLAAGRRFRRAGGSVLVRLRS